MKTLKLKGYISIILIVFISLISLTVTFLGISSYQNSLILKNRKYNLQAKYITESYLNYALLSFIEGEKDFNIKLFPELDHDINIESMDTIKNKVPSIKIITRSSYNNIEGNGIGVLSKYNKIFYIEEDSIIRAGNLSSFYDKALKDLLEKISSGNKYTGELNLLNPNMGEYIASYDHKATLYYKIEENPIFIESLLYSKHFEFINSTDIGDPLEKSGSVQLSGTFYIEGELNLYTDLTLNGIVISNSGVINTNGNNLMVNGVMVEIGEEGSYPNIKVKYNENFVNKYIDFLELGNFNEILEITINSE